VPAFRCLELAPRRTELCVCVPVIDEGERIRRQLGRMRAMAARHDLLIADGGSTDGSLEEAHLREHGVRALLTKTGPGRLSAQLRVAMAYALVEGYRGLIFLDGNDKDDPAAIPRFAAALGAGADHVQGSRHLPGGRGVNTPLSRRLAIRLVASPLVSLASRRRCTDVTNGFRAYSARLLLDERVQPFRDVFDSYELLFYLAIRAARLGFDVRELPVTRTYPRGSRPPTKISPVRGNLRVLKALASSALGRYDPR
jgi:glycosyltransferase involved in cell wall biosynthesis